MSPKGGPKGAKSPRASCSGGVGQVPAQTNKIVAPGRGLWLAKGLFERWHWWFVGLPVRSGQSTMARERMHIFYSGWVQGVGFRFTARGLARRFDVTGWVRNLADGRVELVAEGERSELERFRQAVRDSEVGQFVHQEEVRWESATGGFCSFEIVR